MLRVRSKYFKGVSACLMTIFSLTSSGIANNAYAAISELPQPGSMVQLSQQESVPLLKGLRFDPNDPLNIQFVITKADGAQVSQDEATKLINYFLTSLTVAQEDIWVNLSPYESDRIMDNELAETELGQELLEQDYILKQLSASITHPDTEIGADYWKNIADKTDAFNKIWIMPDEVEIFEGNNAAYVTKSTMKVMTDADLQAMKNNQVADSAATDAIKETLLPKIADDVNNGQNFSKLRQVYNAIVLANWFKAKFRDSFYSFYFDSEKTKGVDLAEDQAKEKVYNMYVDAFKKGAYDFIKKEYDEDINAKVKKHYFSGGIITESSSVVVTDDLDNFVNEDAQIITTGTFFVANDGTVIETEWDGWNGDTYQAYHDDKMKAIYEKRMAEERAVKQQAAEYNSQHSETRAFISQIRALASILGVDTSKAEYELEVVRLAQEEVEAAEYYGVHKKIQAKIEEVAEKSKDKDNDKNKAKKVSLLDKTIVVNGKEKELNYNLQTYGSFFAIVDYIRMNDVESEYALRKTIYNKEVRTPKILPMTKAKVEASSAVMVEDLVEQEESRTYVNEPVSVIEVPHSVREMYNDDVVTTVMSKSDDVSPLFLTGLADIAVKYGTSGDRGDVVEGTINPKKVAKLAAGLAAKVIAEGNQDKPVLIGYDNRLMSREFAYITAAVLAARGVKAELVDVVTPIGTVAEKLYQASLEGSGYAAGVYVTASHNPYHDNGFKPMTADGKVMLTEETNKLTAMTKDIDIVEVNNITTFIDTGLVKFQSLKAEYVQRTVDNLGQESVQKIADYLAREDVNIISEALNGASAGYFVDILEEIMKRGGQDISQLSIEKRNMGIDRMFTGLGVEAGKGGKPNPDSIPEFLQDIADSFAQGKNTVLIARDGDSDRGGIVDVTGEKISANQIMALMAWFKYKYKGQYRAAAKTIPSSDLLKGVIDYINKKHSKVLKFFETLTGFKNLAPVVRDNDVYVAAEESWHIASGDHKGSLDDGNVVGLEVLEMLAVSGKTLTELLEEMETEIGSHYAYGRADISFKGAENELEDLKAVVANNAEIAKAAIAANNDDIVVDYKDEYESIGVISKIKPVAEKHGGISKLIFLYDKTVDNYEGYKVVMADGSWYCFRPSGTEPKMKVYGEYLQSIEEAGSWKAARVRGFNAIDQEILEVQELIGVSDNRIAELPTPYYVATAASALNAETKAEYEIKYNADMVQLLTDFEENYDTTRNKAALSDALGIVKDANALELKLDSKNMMRIRNAVEKNPLVSFNSDQWEIILEYYARTVEAGNQSKEFNAFLTTFLRGSSAKTVFDVVSEFLARKQRINEENYLTIRNHLINNLSVGKVSEFINLYVKSGGSLDNSEKYLKLNAEMFAQSIDGIDFANIYDSNVNNLETLFTDLLKQARKGENGYFITTENMALVKDFWAKVRKSSHTKMPLTLIADTLSYDVNAAEILFSNVNTHYGTQDTAIANALIRNAELGAKLDGVDITKAYALVAKRKSLADAKAMVDTLVDNGSTFASAVVVEKDGTVIADNERVAALNPIIRAFEEGEYTNAVYLLIETLENSANPYPTIMQANNLQVWLKKIADPSLIEVEGTSEVDTQIKRGNLKVQMQQLKRQMQGLIARQSAGNQIVFEKLGLVESSAVEEFVEGGISFDGVAGQITAAKGSSSITLPVAILEKVAGIKIEIVDSYDVDDLKSLYAKKWG